MCEVISVIKDAHIKTTEYFFLNWVFFKLIFLNINGLLCKSLLSQIKYLQHLYHMDQKKKN